MPADERLPTYARFYLHSQLQGDPEPDKDNKPVYADIVYAEVIIKGDKNTSFGRPKRTSDETDYPKAWNGFVEGNDDYSEGTPLKNMPGVGMSDQRNLNSDGIMCVEDLAALPDSVVIGKSGMVDLRKKAAAYLSFLNPEKAERKEAERQAEMDGLKDQLAALQEQINKPRKRGRPAKKEAELQA